MSFRKLEPSRADREKRVTVAIMAPGGTRRHLCVRFYFSEPVVTQLGWKVGETRLDLAIGEDEDAGKAQVALGSRYRCMKVGERGASGRWSAYLIAPLWFASDNPTAALAAEYEIDGSTLTLKLPDFANAPLPGKSNSVLPRAPEAAPLLQAAPRTVSAPKAAPAVDPRRATEPPRCLARDGGRPCGAPAITGTVYCQAHRR